MKMKQSMQYKTKQREIILNYLIEHKEEHIKVEEIYQHLRENNYEVGQTTIYRYLDILVKDGIVRKYILGEKNANCFQYIDNKEACDTHYHAKCDVCGNIYHIECHLLNDIATHLKEKHNYQLNNSKTVLYITCDKCLKKS